MVEKILDLQQQRKFEKVRDFVMKKTQRQRIKSLQIKRLPSDLFIHTDLSLGGMGVFDGGFGAMKSHRKRFVCFTSLSRSLVHSIT